MTVRHADPSTFDAIVAEPGKLLCFYFWGDDCPNCEIFARDLPELLPELPAGVEVVKVNAYEHVELARRFGIAGIPAFVLFKDGRKLGMMRQYHGREYWKTVLTEQAAGA
ncbi:MAG: thioredoxin family protein [Myxococcaceae bacterium]